MAAVYSVQLNISGGGRLGLNFEPGTLEILQISPTGTVAAWNAAHPDDPIRLSDRIIEVNGRDAKTHEANVLLEELRKPQELNVVLCRAFSFSIQLDKRNGQALGLTFDPNTFKIMTIDPSGLVAAWNQSHSRFAVQRGDRVLEVNGKRADEEAGRLQEELRGPNLLNVTVARATDASNVASPIYNTTAVPALVPEDDSVKMPPRSASVFTVNLDKSSGGKLGMKMDGATLTISLIASSGLIADWNQAFPGNQVQTGDRIVAVNGKHQTIHGADELQQTMQNEPKLELKLARAASSAINLDRRSGGTLGCRLDPGTLEIKAVDGTGLVAACNQQYRGGGNAFAVQSDNRLLEENGQRKPHISRELLESDVLNTKLARDPSPLELAEAAPAIYQVKLDKTEGIKLGFGYATGTLEIMAIKSGGLVAAWNEANPSHVSVRVGDTIMEVNGKSSEQYKPEDLHAVIQHHVFLELTLARPSAARSKTSTFHGRARS